MCMIEYIVFQFYLFSPYSLLPYILNVDFIQAVFFLKKKKLNLKFSDVCTRTLYVKHTVIENKGICFSISAASGLLLLFFFFHTKIII